MKKILFIFILFGWSQVFSQTKVKTIETETYTCIYTMENGQLHGRYESKYPNGKTKAIGDFVRNQKLGIWKYFDEEGNLILKRDYLNNFEFSQIKPDLPKDKSIRFLESCKFKLVRNENGYFEYRKLRENDISFSNKVIGIILLDDNKEWFQGEKILQMILENRDSEDFRIFDIFKSYKARQTTIESSENKKIIAFKFTEEYVFDLDQQAMESRIIFICPVIYDTVTNVFSDQDWFYFPAIFPYLTKIDVSLDEDVVNIKNVSDVFFFHAYNQYIISRNVSKNSVVMISDIDSKVFTDSVAFASAISESDNVLIDIVEIEHRLLINNHSVE